MSNENLYETVKLASEEAIRNTSEAQYYSPDNFSYKFNDEFLFSLYGSIKSGKEFGFLIWFLKMMNKSNMLHNVDALKMIEKTELAKATYYRCLKSFEDNNVIIKIDKKTFMVNPNLVVNHRKSLNRDRPQLLSLWSEYQRQKAVKNKC